MARRRLWLFSLYIWRFIGSWVFLERYKVFVDMAFAMLMAYFLGLGHCLVEWISSFLLCIWKTELRICQVHIESIQVFIVISELTAHSCQAQTTHHLFVTDHLLWFFILLWYLFITVGRISSLDFRNLIRIRLVLFHAGSSNFSYFFLWVSWLLNFNL